ncbi:Adenylosuccinate synthase [Fusarium oxysporum]|nr:Adenylosuccinate synthase [Fusarium oxysporum]
MQSVQERKNTIVEAANALMLDLDALDTFETIKVAVTYKFDGIELEHYPADLDMLARAEVVYHELPGWQKPTTGANTFYGLPKQAR